MKLVVERIIAAHERSKRLGFWDHVAGCTFEAPFCTCVNQDLFMKVSLIHSELGEALEEFRLSEEKHGGPLGELLYELSNSKPGPEGYVYRVRTAAFTSTAKPVGFMSELADVAIRVFDLAGGVASVPQLSLAYDKVQRIAHMAEIENGSMGKLLWVAHGLTEGIVDDFGKTTPDEIDMAAGLLFMLDVIAKKVGGDIDLAIDVKMKYNETRTFRHDGKVC